MSDDCKELQKDANDARVSWVITHKGCPTNYHSEACDTAYEAYQEALDAWYDQCANENQGKAFGFDEKESLLLKSIGI